MRRMRWLLCGLALIGGAAQAQAADLGDMFLRGSNATTFSDPRGVIWDGFYAGAHAGMATTGTDFANSTGSLIAFMLRNTTIENENRVSSWTTLGKANTAGPSYGGFVGYQTQWDSAVLGLEAGYNFTNLHTSASDSMSRMFGTSDGYTNNVTVTATSGLRITDYGTIRARGAWSTGPNGSVLPYGFVGLAIGRGNIERSVRVVADGTHASSPPYAFDQTSSENRNGVFAYGYTFGGGVDWAVMQNIFVRAEYEYIQFGAYENLKTHIQTARIGAGVKF
jgi:outer membrane immunogenic protein